MSRPFNFYQEATTGIGASIAPFATFFTGSGIYLPPDLAVGFNAGFLLNLREDDTIYPHKLGINQSGTQVGWAPDNYTLSYDFKGDILPLFSDRSATLSGDVTGEQVKWPPDAPPLSGRFTGVVGSGANDYPSLFPDISGNLANGNVDIPLFAPKINSGNFVSGYNIVATISYDFYGSFIKGNKDYIDRNIVLSGVTYVSGAHVPVDWKMTTGNAIDMNVILVGVVYQ